MTEEEPAETGGGEGTADSTGADDESADSLAAHEGPESATPDDTRTDEPDADGHAARSEAGEGPADGIDAHTTDSRSISARVQILWGVRTLVGVVLLTLGVSYLGIFVTVLPSWTGAVVGALLLAIGAAWVHFRYRVWCYEVRADSLYLERGVFTHVRTIAPFVRIQHVDTQRGPLERWLGLSTLVVYTAGTRGADVSIPGLTPAEASDLQERVKQLAIEAEGGDAV